VALAQATVPSSERAWNGASQHASWAPKGIQSDSRVGAPLLGGETTLSEASICNGLMNGVA
jgi:hypothetical protein